MRHTGYLEAEFMMTTHASNGSTPRESSCPSRTPPNGSVPVSIVVPVKNEAENLRRCLPALAWADEVFVIDSQSTDQTSEVAIDHGATVVQFQFNGTYPKKKNWALENLPFRNEWVLIVDADEVVVPELAVEIDRRIARGEAEGYYLNSRYYFLGRRIRHCGYSECWNLRLFKHRLGRYERMPDTTGGRAGDNEAHEHVELEGRVLRLENELDHHAYPTIAAWVEKHNRYAIWEAALYEQFLAEPIPRTIGPGKRFKRRLKKIALRLPMRPAVRFVYSYFLRWASSMDGLAWSFAACWPSTTSWPPRTVTSNSSRAAPTRTASKRTERARRGRQVPASPSRPVECGHSTACQLDTCEEVDVFVCEEPPSLADDELEVWVVALFDPSWPDVVEEPVDVPV